MRKMLPDGVYIEAIPFEGKKCYYRYSEADFSIYKNELSVVEVQNLRSTIEMLSKYRGLPFPLCLLYKLLPCAAVRPVRQGCHRRISDTSAFLFA